MTTPHTERTKVIIGGHSYTIARGRNGERLWSVKPRPSQPGDPGGIGFRDWIPWGHDLTSRETNGYLGREYGDGTDGRNDQLDTLGPELNTITLSTYDATHAADLLGSTFVLGGSSGILGGAVAVDNADGFAAMKAQGVTYGYITRGQIPAKVRLSSMALGQANLTTAQPAKDIIHTKATLNGTGNEVSIALGPSTFWQSLSEYNVGTADSWTTSTDYADKFGLTPSSVAVLVERTVKQNILTGTVTMADPNLATVSTISNADVTFTGFAMDGNLWVVMTNEGPYFVDDDTGEFTPIIPEIHDSASTENGRGATNWFPVGTIIPLREGVRYQKSLNGQSWGVERFLGNSSPVQGYPTGGDGSLKWFVQAVYNAVTSTTWLVAWRPRQAGDQHPYPLSPYVIGKIPSSAVSRFVSYVGYANGERTLPAWVCGNGSNAIYWVDGRTSRYIDDTSYRYITAGSTYLSELYLDGVIADIEAVEFLTNSATANRTVTVSISTNGGTSYTTVGSAVSSDGFQRLLAVSAGAPNITGAYRIKPKVTYASNVATAAPQVISPIRVYWRWRPLELNEYTFTLDLTDTTVGTAEEQQDQLITEWGSGPVLVAEDLDNDSYYVRVNSVAVHEIADAGGGQTSGSSRGTRRVAEINATQWKVS